MDRFLLGKNNFAFLMAMIFIISSCMPSDVPSTRNRFDSAATTSGSGSGNGNNASPTNGGIGGGSTLPPKVELRHLIEPNLSTDPTYSPGTGHAGGGSYVRKLTLPKNFAGRLYVAGINIGTLSDRHVKVRFKFGVSRDPIVIPATVTQAPGITPQTGISVLVLDMRSEPFRNVRLPYDLFDYNEYDFNNPSISPTQDNRNSGLYCRGLRIEDDPTFVGVGACDGNEPDEECLYAYAKVLDQGLLKQASGSNLLVPLSPSRPQIKSINGASYYQDYLNEQLKKPLLDTINLAAAYTPDYYRFSDASMPVGATDAFSIVFENVTSPAKSIWDPVTINGDRYYYRGPYRLINKSAWYYKFADLTGAKGLFRKDSYVNYPTSYGFLPDDPTESRLYFNSYLFPLATKLDLMGNVSYLGSDTVNGVRTEKYQSAPGLSTWMDGANARAQSKNADLEHIGSCNVTGSIEVIAKDNNGVEYVVASSKDVKLQLVRPTQHLTDTGNEVLYTNFKTCSSNTSCGQNECCFNNRCWDQSLTSQCMEPDQGNLEIGQACSTDLQCSSLCCNRTSGLCSPHNSLLKPAVLCSKPIGDFCIAKEWCQKSSVVKCLIVKTGTDPQGKTTCRQQCYTTQEHGDCKQGICIPPVQEVIPSFNPDAEGACDNAMPAPSF